MGTQSSIGALTELANDRQPTVSTQAKFALQLIAHRNNIPGFAVAPPREQLITPADGMVPFSVKNIKPGLFSKVITHLNKDSYGIRFSERASFNIECGRNNFVFAVDEAHLNRGITKMALQRPILVGSVAQFTPVDGSYSISRLVLAGPLDHNHYYIGVYRTDGVLVHYGTGQGEGDTSAFEIKSVHARGNEVIDLKGRVTGPRIDITQALSTTTVQSKSMPTPFDPNRNATTG